jgi:adenine phosphoribosyltransferase
MNQLAQQIEYKDYVREVDNFPRQDITFYDIAPLIGNGEAFSGLIKNISEPLKDKIDKVIGFDARGFLFAGAIAVELGVGLVMLRKPGKLPGSTLQTSYDLEYGSNSLEIQDDAIKIGERVVMIDDIIATGGTALAGIGLVKECGADVVEFCSVIDLTDLKGSDKIRQTGVPVRSIIEIKA